MLMRNVGFKVSDTVANKEEVAVIYKIKIHAWSSAILICLCVNLHS